MSDNSHKLSNYLKKGQESNAHKLSNFRKPEAPEEGFWSKLPRNVVAGLAGLGHRTLNSPHDLVAGIEGQFQNFGQSLDSALPKELEAKAHPAFKLSEQIPTQEEHNYAELLGQKGEPTIADSLIQKGIEYSPDFLSLASIYKDLPIALFKKGASKELRKAQQLAAERNLSNINIPEHMIEDARQFLPNTHAYRTLLNEARLGNYDPIFALQSDLGKAGSGFKKSFSFAERRAGKEAHKLRFQMLDQMRHELGKQGNLDIADLLRKGQRRYKNYMRLKPYRNAALIAGATSMTPIGSYAKKLISSALNLV